MCRMQSMRSGRARMEDRSQSRPNAGRPAPRRPALSAAEMTAARAFYARVLRGRRVRRDVHDGTLAFIVGETVVDVRPDLGGAAPAIVLPVENPDAVAQRCWDAGFTVRVGQDRSGEATISVIDPFGRRLDLAPTIGLTSRTRAMSKEAS